MKTIKGGVSTPKGFTANGLHCGIKRSKKYDLSLIVSKTMCSAAGVFTLNSVKAAPVLVTKKHIQNGKAQAIIANSGNANCFTHEKGKSHAVQTARAVARALKLTSTDVLVASTGIIGKPLPIKKMLKAVPDIVKGLRAVSGTKAAKGILTTDTVKKEIAVTLNIGGKKVTIGGCAKGAGMIEPNMATMLGFITTDAAISPVLLKKALKQAVEPSFNCITIDGCMSTNDMVLVLANGLAGNKKITANNTDYKAFSQALQFVCMDLAKKIVLDGEGATKFIEINVRGARTYDQAKLVAKTIANSNLVKTAAFGSNPNWGRFAAAVGSLGLKITDKQLKMKFSSFKNKTIRIHINLNSGRGKATVYTSDLSHEYVKINAEYN